MKTVESTEDHLVLHDATILVAAGWMGAVAAAIAGDPAVGFTTASVLSAVGIGGMKVGPVRRGVNRVAMAAVKASK